MPLYFAYGRLMDEKAMAARCPGAKVLGRAHLDGFRFIVTSEGAPSLVKAPMSSVHGVLWDLRIGEVAVVDGSEALFRRGMDKIYYPIRFKGQMKNALIYLSQTVRTGKAQEKAFGGVVSAAQSWGFPDIYVNELKKWVL